MKKITVAEYVAQFFSDKGITHSFMVTGGGAMFLNDAISKNKKIKTICFHHEQACTIAAESYFKTSNKPVLVNVTTGPGSTNAITGVYGAYVDSAAMIVVSGQVKRATLNPDITGGLRQLGDQEVDIISMVKKITKYSVQIIDAHNLEFELEKAWSVALAGRPGPVWIDIPIDIQSQLLPPQVKKFKINKEKKHNISAKDFKILKERILKANRPVVIAGTGINLSETPIELKKFIEKFHIPLVTSFCGSDVLEDDHPQNIGRQGTIGDRAGNFAVQNADLVIILGSRLNIRQVSYNWNAFAKDAFKIMVDIDPHELKKKTLKIDLKIQSDLRLFFKQCCSISNSSINKNRIKFLSGCQKLKRQLPTVTHKQLKSKLINPYVFMDLLSKVAPKGKVVVTADGAAAIISFQAFKIKKGQRLFSNSGSAPMGYDLPAAIGAAIAANEIKKHPSSVYCFAGDGSIMMNLQELQTISTLKLPVQVFLINNGGYQSILQTQKKYFPNNIFGCQQSNELGFPQFQKIAEAFNIKYFSIKTIKDFQHVVKNMKNDQAYFIEVFVDQTQEFEPKLVSRRNADGTFESPELDDMYPFLDRKFITETRKSLRGGHE